MKLSITAIGLSSVAIAIAVFTLMKRPNIAYVKSYDLVENYEGTKIARIGFEKRKSAMVSNVDSLKMNFEQAKNEYFQTAHTMSQATRAQQEELLTGQHSQLQQYMDAIDQKIQEEDTKMTEEVLNQINSFVKEYANENGYSIIMGTTAAGSLLYGDEAMDITDELTKALNQKFHDKK